MTMETVDINGLYGMSDRKCRLNFRDNKGRYFKVNTCVVMLSCDMILRHALRLSHAGSYRNPQVVINWQSRVMS